VSWSADQHQDAVGNVRAGKEELDELNPVGRRGFDDEPVLSQHRGCGQESDAEQHPARQPGRPGRSAIEEVEDFRGHCSSRCPASEARRSQERAEGRGWGG